MVGRVRRLGSSLVAICALACGARTSTDDLRGGLDEGLGGAPLAAGGHSGGASCRPLSSRLDLSEACAPSGGSGGSSGEGAGGADAPGSVDGNCCDAHAGLGCEVGAISVCTCSLDPVCCTQGWDESCVGTATNLCGACGGDPVSSGGSPAGGAAGSGGSAGGGASGGAANTGGGGTSGGASGVAECKAAFPTECGSCLCDTCYTEIRACVSDLGCLSIAGCIADTECIGTPQGCYHPSSCKTVIDSFGGLTGGSLEKSLDFAVCRYFSACSCDE